MTFAPWKRWVLRLGVVAALISACVDRAAAQPDPTLKPVAGAVALKAGFVPDPHKVAVTAGGTQKTQLGGISSHVSKAPTYRLNYTNGGYPLTIHVESKVDTTLVIRLPDGKWIGSDDANGLNPLVRLAKPASGQYDIYVGTFGVNPAQATLYITELQVNPPKKEIATPGGKRPFFIIGHHANTKAEVDAYVAAGANLIECDIHNYARPFGFANGSGTDQIYVMHFFKDEFTRKFTNSNGVDAYFANIKAKMDAGQISGLLLDIKATLVSDGPIHYSSSYPNPRDYGRRVANYMKRHGIPANRVIMGVDEMTYDTALSNLFNVPPSGSQWARVWGEQFMIGVRVDAKYDCLLNIYIDPSVGNDWADRINAVSDVASLGMDEAVRGDNFDSKWKSNLQKLINLRDQKKGDLRFTYFWTVDNDRDLRKCLNENVDGIITNTPAKLKAILNEPGYQAKYRIATSADYPVPLASRVKRSLEDPYVYANFHNRAAFDTRFRVEWTGKNGQAQSWDSPKLMAGQGAVCPVPRTAANYRVSGTWSNGSSYRNFSEGTYTVAGGSSSRFETRGTLFYKWFERK